MKQNHEGKVNKFVRPYQICTNCVMDTSDSKIVFNEKGMCDFCVDFYENIICGMQRWAGRHRSSVILE